MLESRPHVICLLLIVQTNKIDMCGQKCERNLKETDWKQQQSKTTEDD